MNPATAGWSHGRVRLRPRAVASFVLNVDGADLGEQPFVDEFALTLLSPPRDARKAATLGETSHVAGAAGVALTAESPCLFGGHQWLKLNQFSHLEEGGHDAGEARLALAADS